MAEGELERSCSTCQYYNNMSPEEKTCGECLFSDKPVLPYWVPMDIVHPEEEVKSLFDDWDDEEWEI